MSFGKLKTAFSAVFSVHAKDKGYEHMRSNVRPAALLVFAEQERPVAALRFFLSLLKKIYASRFLLKVN